MEKYSVTASILNIRREPKIADGNIIAKTSKYCILELVDKTQADWWKIKIPNSSTEGYVKSDYLSFVQDMPTVHQGITAVHFPASPKASLATKEMMHTPIGDSTIPFRDTTSTASKQTTIPQIISKLNVSVSLRYQKTAVNTFCNIYAYDYCYFCVAYLPRVWWTQKAIKELSQGLPVSITYGETVHELNANSLHDWLLSWGNDFEWERVYDITTLQNLVNDNGGVGIICAKRKDLKRSGHIVVVVPEDKQHQAYRSKNEVIYPLQSQAGSFNYNYFSSEKKAWWQGSQFASFVFYFHN